MLLRGIFAVATLYALYEARVVLDPRGGVDIDYYLHLPAAILCAATLALFVGRFRLAILGGASGLLMKAASSVFVLVTSVAYWTEWGVPHTWRLARSPVLFTLELMTATALLVWLTREHVHASSPRPPQDRRSRALVSAVWALGLWQVAQAVSSPLWHGSESLDFERIQLLLVAALGAFACGYSCFAPWRTALLVGIGSLILHGYSLTFSIFPIHYMHAPYWWLEVPRLVEAAIAWAAAWYLTRRFVAVRGHAGGPYLNAERCR